MRPERLVVEGFRSYADRAEFDFRDRSLVAIVGPTGSGKSSILDGIAYALYGRTPSMPGNATKPLIHRWDPVREASPTSAKVELWFTVGADTYRIVRSIKPKGTGDQVLERWDAVDGSKLETVADKAREIGDVVERLTGLDFDTFMRSVLLAQNQFQVLLGAPPAVAAKVLTGLFGFGVIAEMRDIAKVRLAKAEAELEAAAKARTALEGLEGQAEEARTIVAAAKAREDDLAVIEAEVAAVTERLSAGEAELGASTERLARIAAALDGLPTASAVADVVGEAADHEQLLAAARDAASTASAELAEADRALDAALAAGTPDTLAQLEGAIAELDRCTRALGGADAALDAARSVSADAAVAHDTAAAAATTARDNEARASEAAEAAASALRVTEAAHAAHLLASDLVPGEPCPVCARTVEGVPELAPAEGLESAREAAMLATERAEAAAIARQRAEHELVGSASRLEAATDRVTAATEQQVAAHEALVGARDAVVGLVGAVHGDPDDPEAALAAARTAFGRLGEAKREAAERLRRAEAAVAGLEGSTATTAVADVWEAHRSAAAMIDLDPDTWDDVAGAGRAMAAIRAALTEARQTAEEAQTAAATAVESASAERAAVLERVGLAPDADLGDARTRAAESRAAATARLEVLEEQVAGGRRALADAERTAELALRLQRIHADLAPGKFPQYLIDEKRHELAMAGSDWFRRLSSGRYEFALAENRFKVRELTAAGIVRDAETLSGGETFVASLALALGLASIVGLDRATAQAFFIDEGFGSLDADSLDLAMEGIEQLVSEDGDRLVVVVSHVPEMRARIEDLIVLNKDPVTGTTSVIRG